MPTIAESEHERFIKSMNNKTLIKNVKAVQTAILSQLVGAMSMNIVPIEYLRWLIVQMENYYVVPVSNGRFCLIDKSRKSEMILGLVTPHKETKTYFKGNQSTLEISNIHSIKKGEGYKMMKRAIEVAKTIKTPISLWAETDHNVKYFERYGFKDYGKAGVNNEHLMIMKPSNIS